MSFFCKGPHIIYEEWQVSKWNEMNLQPTYQGYTFLNIPSLNCKKKKSPKNEVFCGYLRDTESLFIPL